MWLNPGVVPPPSLAGLVKKGSVRVNGPICFGICHAYVYGGSRVP